MVLSGSPGGDCGCASRERAGVAGLATSVLPLSGPASARDDCHSPPLPECRAGHTAGCPLPGEFLLPGRGTTQQAGGGSQVGKEKFRVGVIGTAPEVAVVEKVP